MVPEERGSEERRFPSGDDECGAEESLGFDEAPRESPLGGAKDDPVECPTVSGAFTARRCGVIVFMDKVED